MLPGNEKPPARVEIWRIKVTATYFFPPFFIEMKQTIYLSTKIASEAVSSKEMAEALAFALCIKLTFVSSRVQSATVRRCKALFHVGQDRISRMIKNGIKYGYLVRDGQDLIAVSLKTPESYHVRLDFQLNTYKFQTEEKGCKYHLNSVIDLIRKSVLLNHISKQSDCRDTLKNAHEPCGLKTYKKSRNKIKRMLHAGRLFDGVSNARIRNLCSVGRAKARRLINSLVSSGNVIKEEVSVETGMDIRSFNRERANAFFKESGDFGYLYRKGNSILCRVSNRYIYDCDLISFIK